MEDCKTITKTQLMNKFHNTNLSGVKFLVTGGSGFIGSHIVDYLLAHGAFVRVLDNLSNGYFENISHNIANPNFEFIEGDIRDYSVCENAVREIQYISHQAALGSVPRSIENPILTNEVNIGGFLNMLTAAKNSKSLVKFIYAASSSTYGDSMILPKVEGNEGKPLSPYAVTKAVNETYGDVFSKVYGFHTIGLRYFNIFGPRQNPDNPYAAVIPIFCSAFINNKKPTINGDGETSRDFTFVENAVQANIKAMLSLGLENHEVFNVACGDQVSLNEMIDELNTLSSTQIEANYGPERKGDVKHSKASIEKIGNSLGYKPTVTFSNGLRTVFEWYKESAILNDNK
jgi:UDP-N-acetylglucosamine/UDP-N-acetylgalactosamine 4-epimerase